MQSIVGTWKLIAAAARDRNGNPVPDPYGGRPMGRVMFTADGRMMAVTCDGRADLPPGDEARVQLVYRHLHVRWLAPCHAG